jgi:hypothetical protein
MIASTSCGLLGQDAQVIAQKLDRVMVAVEFREVGEQRRLGRPLDVTFEREVALGLGQLEHREQHAQQLLVGGLVVFRALEQLAHGLQRAHQHLFRVGDDERPEGAAENDHEFDRLPQQRQVAVDRVAPEDGADDDQQSDDEKHSDSQFPEHPVRGDAPAALSPKVCTL